MYKFPRGYYTDVRIENKAETIIGYVKEDIQDCREREYSAAFIRVFDGKRWYYSSTSEVENIQAEIEKLCEMAEYNEDIENHPIVKKFQSNNFEVIKFEEDDIRKVSLDEKIDLIKSYFHVYQNTDEIKMWRIYYTDEHVIKNFYSSKGTNLTFDFQLCGFAYSFQLADGEKMFNESYSHASNYFEKLKIDPLLMVNKLEKCVDFLKNSKHIEPGKYQVILSPMVAGVFAHESFGHKSEADFMIGDETMKKEWAIGKKVGSDILSIIDDGNEMGSGFVPFDDDGTKAEKTFLIKNGVLDGRLHSAITAESLDEELTGNSRSMNFTFEPIVRMTTTYIDKGEKSKDQLFKEVKNGLYVESLKHGSGMSTFTIAPTLCYMIENGKITDPVNVSVLTGDVFKTLNEIDGLSDEIEIKSFVGGGCGKNEQWPLSVGFGGPYVRVNNMNVQ